MIDMARVKIEMPDSFIFSTDIAVRIGDVNYGGHVGHDSVLSITHEARVRLFKSMGASETDVFGGAIVLADAHLSYTNESFYGDTLNVKIARGEFSKSGLELFYLVSERRRGVEVARVKTGVVFFDYEKRKAMRVPEEFRRLLLEMRPL